MKKVKIILMVVLFIAILFGISTSVDAAVSYTRTFPDNKGTIVINLTGLTLDTSKAYSYALVTRGGTPETWHTLTEYTKTTAEVNLSGSTSDIVNVLRLTDTGILYVKDNSDDSYIVNALEVDLKLPYLQALSYNFYDGGNCYQVDTLYGKYANDYQAIQKVTDKTLIEQFLKVKNSNGDITSLEEYLPSVPKTGYNDIVRIYDKDNDGLYLVWVKLSADSCKDIYGCIIHDGLPEATKLEQYIAGSDVEAPTVTSIQVTSPESGTYKTNQTVKIHVNFSETITGTSVPTLKIKFGESAERSLTNGVIKSNYIEYSYNIQASDKGQLATVSLTGGAIADAAENKAKLSCPIISGNTIKANVEGTTTNNTDNQDKNNNNTNNSDSTNNTDTNNNNNNSSTNNNGTGNSNTDKNNTGNSGTNNSNVQNSGTSNKADTTVAPSKLPQTGLSMGIVMVIVAMLGVGALTYFKYNSYRDIK